MLLSFPYMHPELVPGVKADGMRFFDPGLAETPGECSFRPEGLPLDRKTAAALIRDCINFGEQFKDPAEMAYFGAVSADDFYEGSSMSIQNQLMQQFRDGQGEKEERQARENRARAQFILLLAWSFEEKMMELASIEQGVKNSWKSMDQTLGVDDEDRYEEKVLDLGNRLSHTGGVSDEQRVPLPWQRIIEALPAFIPEDSVLVCVDKEIIAAWDDLEIAFGEGGDDLPEGAVVATLPAWQFAGRRKAPANLPLALKEVTVAIIR
ncbi:hypothetical protein GM415_14565 [Pseudodesulfovibrio cashew]|uniref:Uncharacterized protein n=1 Tax=Pseudodesulfovibrio cashew TaxID=2678688 RepID=A0A6I6JJZ3_9BACT|nr:hypothetical protein [Pseudodesulfovibrio cashew]QGY41298.1 hypothetical protein GM415_14565 [Pseudodesulfovibrio cashew]